MLLVIAQVMQCPILKLLFALYAFSSARPALTIRCFAIVAQLTELVFQIASVPLDFLMTRLTVLAQFASTNVQLVNRQLSVACHAEVIVWVHYVSAQLENSTILLLNCAQTVISCVRLALHRVITALNVEVIESYQDAHAQLKNSMMERVDYVRNVILNAELA